MMKVAILAGGSGSRLAEETEVRPKPLVEIGGRPILWHIMRQYAHFQHKAFYLALGYKGDLIKRYFVDLHALGAELCVDFRERRVGHGAEPDLDWKVHLVETGLATQTGGRIRRLRDQLHGATFFLTYGDGVSDIDLDRLLAFHRSHGKLATLTAVRPPARYGSLVFEGDRVCEFKEKPREESGWINGGFFVLEPGIFAYLDGDETVWEREPLEALARDGQLMAYRHEGFWQCMDTLHEKRLLEALWQSGQAPWCFSSPTRP